MNLEVQNPKDLGGVSMEVLIVQGLRSLRIAARVPVDQGRGRR